MADNITLPSGTGGPTIASDDIGGIHYPRNKVVYGVDGSSTDVSDTTPLPTKPGGNVAHDAPDSGNPLKIGGKASGAIPAAVTAADRVDAWFDPQGAQVSKLREWVSYGACYRLVNATAGQLSLTVTFVANTNQQLATIYHTALSTKTVRIRSITLAVSTGAAGVFGFEIRRISATTPPATGNPAITPMSFDPAAAAAEATCLALPTTGGSPASTDSIPSKHIEWNAAAAAAAANPMGLADEEIVLFEANSALGIQPLIMRSATAEGYAVSARCTAAVALRYTAYIVFTEE